MLQPFNLTAIPCGSTNYSFKNAKLSCNFVLCSWVGCYINLPSVLFVLVGHVLGPGLGDHLHVVGREHLQQPEDS